MVSGGIVLASGGFTYVLRLNLSHLTKKRLPVLRCQSLVVIPHPNTMWAVDFMSDTLYEHRSF